MLPLFASSAAWIAAGGMASLEHPAQTCQPDASPLLLLLSSRVSLLSSAAESSSAQLPDVASVVVGEQRRDQRSGQSGMISARREEAHQGGVRSGGQAEEVGNEQGDVLATLVEGGDLDLVGKPGEEVMLERALWTVGGGDEAKACCPGAALPEPMVLAVVEDAEESGLHGLRQLSDLIEEQGAAICRADQSWPRRHACLPGDSSARYRTALRRSVPPAASPRSGR
ncbi:MAG: hypothetical protein ACI8S6_004508 [Myxococcota bacterium]|jgi:hypothetical protein